MMSGAPQRPPPPKPARSRTLDRNQRGIVAMGSERNGSAKPNRPLSVDESRLSRISRSVSPDFVTADLGDPKIRRRSYTYTSKQISQRPPPPRRQISATTDSIVKVPSQPPPPPARPEPPVEKTNTSSPAHRPSRPPPPRAKSLPKVASLTTYKAKRDNNEFRRPHSATNENVHSIKTSTHLDVRQSSISPPPGVGRRRATSPEGGVMERNMKTRNQGTNSAGLSNHVETNEDPPQKPARRHRTPLSSPSRDPPNLPPPIFEQQTMTSEDTDHNKTDTITDTTTVDTSIQSSGSQTDVQFELTPNSIVPPVPPRPVRPPRPFPPPPGGNKASKRSPKSGQSNGGSPKHRTRPKDPSRRSPRSVRHTQLKKHNAGDTEEQTVVTPEESGNTNENDEHIAVGDGGDNNQADDRGTPSESTNNNHQSPPEQLVSVNSRESGLSVKTTSPTHVNHSGAVPDGVQSNKRIMKSRTVYERTEDDDVHVAPRPHSASSPHKGRKFFTSMKKSFHSLRKPRRKDEDSSMRSEADLDGLYPDPLPHGILNQLVVQCVAYLNRETVLKEVGLFRVPGDVAVIKRLRARFLDGEEVDLTEILDPHTVTGLLKLHFREQRVSMIPRGQPLSAVNAGVKAKDVQGVRNILDTIEPMHIATLKIVCEMLARVSAYSDMNQMTSGILATSCGPSMFPYLPPSSANGVLKFLIDHSNELFSV